MQIFRMMLEDKELPVGSTAYTCMVHSDDIIQFVPRLWAAASVPANIVNLGGDDICSYGEMIEYMTELTGVPGRLAESESGSGIAPDWTKRRSITGPAQSSWKAGIRLTLKMFYPELLKDASGSLRLPRAPDTWSGLVDLLLGARRDDRSDHLRH
jgi:UDP-glucuronate 4-epimerase